jgi:hypothetical protein
MFQGNPVKIFVGGIVVIGLVAAVGLHAGPLANLTNSAGTASKGLLATAETGTA